MKALLSVLFLVLTSALLVAQAPAPAAPAAPMPAAATAKGPVLDESDALAIQVVQLSAQRAQDLCANSETTKAFQSLQQQAIARFAKKYPAYTVDFGKGTLVPKVAAK